MKTIKLLSIFTLLVISAKAQVTAVSDAKIGWPPMLYKCHNLIVSDSLARANTIPYTCIDSVRVFKYIHRDFYYTVIAPIDTNGFYNDMQFLNWERYFYNNSIY